MVQKKYPSKMTGEIVEWAKPYGWKMAGYRGDGHVRMVHPETGQEATLPASPSSRNTVKVEKAKLLKMIGAKDENRAKAGKFRKGTGRKPGYVNGFTPDYSDTPWDAAYQAIEDIDNQLSVLDPQRHPMKARKLVAERLRHSRTLQGYHKPVPRPPLVS